VETFQTKIVWQRGREFLLSARENADLVAATPPQFGGPAGIWSPEELLVGSVGGCLLSTFLYFAHRFDVPFNSCSSTSRGTLEKTSEGLRFTGMDVAIAVAVPDEEAVEKVSSLRMKEKLEKYCPVSASLNCPVRLVLEVMPASQGDREGLQSTR
jgi:organic hydroperoxide reductase OsmC/OhrA